MILVFVETGVGMLVTGDREGCSTGGLTSGAFVWIGAIVVCVVVDVVVFVVTDRSNVCVGGWSCIGCGISVSAYIDIVHPDKTRIMVRNKTNDRNGNTIYINHCSKKR